MFESLVYVTVATHTDEEKNSVHRNGFIIAHVRSHALWHFRRADFGRKCDARSFQKKLICTETLSAPTPIPPPSHAHTRSDVCTVEFFDKGAQFICFKDGGMDFIIMQSCIYSVFVENLNLDRSKNWHSLL